MVGDDDHLAPADLIGQVIDGAFLLLAYRWFRHSVTPFLRSRAARRLRENTARMSWCAQKSPVHVAGAGGSREHVGRRAAERVPLIRTTSAGVH